MGQKQCDKCGETVDEAKAFCPACGNAFVAEEKRQKISEYDSLDKTMQVGQTMYGKMMSDLGQSASRPPAVPEKRVEVIAPVACAVKPQPVRSPEPVAKSNKKWWFIIGGVIFVLGFVVVI